MSDNNDMDINDKLKEYEEILAEMMKKADSKDGTVLSENVDGLYRVGTSNGDVLARCVPNISPAKGQRIILTANIISAILPEGLEKEETEYIDFDRIEWNAIGGMDSQISRIRDSIENPVKHRDLYKEFNLQPNKGVLLYGPPGCGKTMIAKAIASTIIPNGDVDRELFHYVKGGELLSKWVGESERHIKEMFESTRETYAKTGKMPIIFIDEAEAILPRRGSRVSSDVDKTIVPTFLSEMDGFARHNPYLILATNHMNQLDPAVIRPGRIDLKVLIDRPTKEDSVDIFKIYLDKTKLIGNTDEIAQVSTEHLFKKPVLVDQVSGAFINNIVSNATHDALMRKINNRKIKTGVTIDDVINAINEY